MRLLNRNLSNTLPLFALCAVLGGVIYLELQDWPTAPRQVAVAVPQAPVAAPGKADVAPAGFRLASLQSFAETTNRPLFRENRRPLEVAAPQADGEAGEISVVGIVLSKAHRVALMRTEAAGPITRVGPGQVIGGWEVETISPTSVVLKRAGKTLELGLKYVPSSAGGTSAN